MPYVYGIEEVKLDIKDLREVDASSQTSYLLEEVLTKHFDKSPVETVHLFGYYRAAFDYEDDDLTYGFSSMSAGIDGDFKDGKTHYEMRFRFNPKHDCSFCNISQVICILQTLLYRIILLCSGIQEHQPDMKEENL